MVDLGGYVIILVETNDKRVKLYGSRADKADLEVADEILEINGKALHNCSHTEVIAHIHNVSTCIRYDTLQHYISPGGQVRVREIAMTNWDVGNKNQGKFILQYY